MRIKKLQLSNILSFPFVNNIDEAPEIVFDSALNILIGGNGSGKSTVLEVISFVARRVFFKPYEINENLYNETSGALRLDAIHASNDAQKYKATFRLNPNWGTEEDPQAIKIVVQLDEIDKNNIDIVIGAHAIISGLASKYTRIPIPQFSSISGNEELEITISLDTNNDSFSLSSHNISDGLMFYLTNFELLRELILIHNENDTSNPITPLSDTFTMLSAFRNYSTFSSATSLQQSPRTQARGIRQSNRSRGINTPDGGEPTIFSLVKIKIASRQFDLMNGPKDKIESVAAANKLAMVKRINKKLKIINLKCYIKLIDARSWSYSFEFFDTKHKRTLGDINSLSAGQRSIIHLVFEAYGQDETQGGVVVIDEPEIHLHYQFQDEYLRILQEIIQEQSKQYILVTHSDGFIDSSTASYIKRFSLDSNRHSIMKDPVLTTGQKKMIEILDNKQSARALFANKIVLVEGPDDRYFFRAVLDNLHSELRQEISIYDTGGHNSQKSWREFFESFGLIVYQIKDLDAVAKDIYNLNARAIKSSGTVTTFKSSHTNIDVDIESKYADNIFYLKHGPLEAYMGWPSVKGMDSVITFCQTIDQFLTSNSNLSNEITDIINRITK